MKTQLRYILLSFTGLLFIIALYYLVHLSANVYTAIKAHDARMTESYDYTKRTRPLPQNVVDDICKKFSISSNDKRCQPGTVVYGPDFFQDIKKYFNELPKQEKIVPIVDEKLEAYLVNCGGATKDGIYRCRYDLGGDGKYTIAIYFTKEGFLYDIMAPIGGS